MVSKLFNCCGVWVLRPIDQLRVISSSISFDSHNLRFTENRSFEWLAFSHNYLIMYGSYFDQTLSKHKSNDMR